jgi:hypothetical protein
MVIMNITEIIKGASYSWTEALSDYLPSDGWDLAFYFRGVGDGFNVSATVENNIFQLNISADDTATLTVGNYSWQGFVSKDDENICIAQGKILVKTGFVGLEITDQIDNRSAIKIALDAIDALLANKATLDQQRYVIGNRQLDRIPIPDLLNLRKEYQKLYNQELRAEAAKNGKFKVFTPYYARFKRPE